jgi:hypothetical protein
MGDLVVVLQAIVASRTGRNTPFSDTEMAKRHRALQGLRAAAESRESVHFDVRTGRVADAPRRENAPVPSFQEITWNTDDSAPPA